MSAFEDRLRQVRDTSGDDYYLGLETIAEGLAEIIALLTPLVETVTAKPEPLKLRSQPGQLPCLAGDPGSNGFRRCMEPYGHAGDHRHRDGLNAGVEHVWAQPGIFRHLGVMNCGDVRQFAGEPDARRCVLRPDHVGVHCDGDEGRFW